MVASTNRKDFALRCDKLVWLHKGRIIAFDTPDNVMAKLPDDLLF
jgi:hypothetical protein